MPTRINRLLIPFVLLILVSLGSQAKTNAQAPKNISFLPVISNDPSSWIGPYGGTIVAIAADPTTSQLIYAGTFGSGVYKSMDGGNFWNEINLGLTNLEIYSLAIDPTQPSTLYAGTYGSKVFKSTDGGSSWTWSGTGMQDQAIVYSLAVDPIIPSNVYAATRGISGGENGPWNGVIYKSADAGETWAPTLFNVGGSGLQDWAYSLSINPNNHAQVFAALHQSGPYLLNDSGWHSIPDGATWSGRSIVINPQLDNSSPTLYYGVWRNSSVYKINYSDISWTWEDTSNGIGVVKVYSIAIDPLEVDTVYLATFSGGILKTTNAGASWQPSGLQTDQLYAIVINPTMANNLYAGTSGNGLYRSTDFSASWVRSDNGIYNSMATSVIHDPKEPNLMYSSVYGAGVYQSENGGQNWVQINNGLDDTFVHDLVMDPMNANVLYALTDTGGLFKNVLTSGSGWVSAGQGLPLTNYPLSAFPENDPYATIEMQEAFTTPKGQEFVSQLSTAGLLKMVYAPSDPRIVYIGTVGKGVYRSTDGATSWQSVGLGGNNVRSLAVDPTNPNLVYATIDNYGSMLVSTDGGSSWNNAYLPANFYSVATSPFENGTVYAGTGIGFYRYQSGSWSALGLTDKTVTYVAADPTHAGILYAGTTNGAFYTRDNGITWNLVDNHLNGQTITSINFDKTNPALIYFSTKTHGIYMAFVRF